MVKRTLHTLIGRPSVGQSLIQFTQVMTFVLVLSTCRAQAQSIPPVDRIVLPNGLTLLVCPDTTLPLITYHTFVDAGSRDETISGYTGIMRILGVIANRFPPASMMQFTQDGPGLAPSKVEVGEDYTLFETGAVPGNLETLIRVEAQRIREVPLTASEVERAIRGSLALRAQTIDSVPSGFLRQELLRNTFRRHTYRHPILGWESDLTRTGIYSELERLRDVFYRPNYTTIVICGDFDPDRAAELILEHYGEWRPALPPTSQVLFESTQNSRVTRTFDWPDSSEAPRVGIAYRIPDFNLDQPDLAALQVLSEVLFDDSGFVSRRFRQSRINCDIRYDIDGKKDPYLLSVELVDRDELATEEVVESFDNIVDSFHVSEISDSILARARDVVKRKVLDVLAKPYGWGRLIGHFQLVGGDYRMIDKYIDAIDMVRYIDVIGAREKYLQKSASTVVYLNPR